MKSLVLLVAIALFNVNSAFADLKSVSHVMASVTQYDEAIAYYTQKLGMELRADIADDTYGPGFRWVNVGVVGQPDFSIVLHKAETNGRAWPAFIIVTTDNIRKDYDLMRARGVEFTMPLTEAPYGTFTFVKEPFGNEVMLIQKAGK